MMFLIASYFSNEVNQFCTREHNLWLFKLASSSSLRKNYFSNTVINEWNNLPAIIVNAKSVIEFEKLYDDFTVTRSAAVNTLKNNGKGFNRPMASLSLLISYHYQ